MWRKKTYTNLTDLFRMLSDHQRKAVKSNCWLWGEVVDTPTSYMWRVTVNKELKNNSVLSVSLDMKSAGKKKWSNQEIAIDIK